MHQLHYKKNASQTTSYLVTAPTCFGAKVPSSGSFSATSFRGPNLLVFKNMKCDLFGH